MRKICNKTYPSADSNSVCLTFLSYGMMRIAGSDVVTQKMENTGGVVSEETLDAAREQLGLDKSISDAVFRMAWKIASGKYGKQLCIRLSGL